MTLRPEELRALEALSRVLREGGWTFVVVGARAPWILVSPGTDPRGTRDLDAVVSVSSWQDFERLTDQLRALGFDRREMHKLVSPDGAEVDLIPFGPGIIRDDRLEWPDGTVMSAAGLAEAFGESVEREVAPGLGLRVVTEPAFALLKIVAYTDRPRERSRDLLDLIDGFERYEADGDRRFELVEVSVDGEPVRFEEAGAYLLGLDTAAIARPNTRVAVQGFMKRFTDEYAEPISQLVFAERRLHSDDRRREVLRLFRVFGAGFARP